MKLSWAGRGKEFRDGVKEGEIFMDERFSVKNKSCQF